MKTDRRFVTLTSSGDISGQRTPLTAAQAENLMSRELWRVSPDHVFELVPIKTREEVFTVNKKVII
jgi:hypothetical protein